MHRKRWGGEVSQLGLPRRWAVGVSGPGERRGISSSFVVPAPLLTADCRLPTADRRPRTADRRPPTADRRLPTADRRLPAATRRLPTVAVFGSPFLISRGNVARPESDPAGGTTREEHPLLREPRWVDGPALETRSFGTGSMTFPS